MDNLFVHLDAMSHRHCDALDTSKLKDGPDREAVFSMYSNMRWAVDEFPWAVVLKDVFFRGADSDHDGQVRVIVDATKEYCFCLRHPCVDFDWAPDRLTCCCPLSSSLLVTIRMKEVTGQHGPWCGSRNPFWG